MVHNGIEYGLMQAYAEGFDILKNAASSSLPEEQRYRFRTRSILPSFGDTAASYPLGFSIWRPERWRRILSCRPIQVTLKIPAKAAGQSLPRSTEQCLRK